MTKVWVEPGQPVAAGAGQLEQNARECSHVGNAPRGDASPKAWQTRQAVAALAGFGATIIEADDGAPALVVTRWALTRAFFTIREFDVWVAHVAPHLVVGSET